MIKIVSLDLEISSDVAAEYLEYRQAMEPRFRLKTQKAFDRQMKAALRAYEIGMTPDQLIEFTIDQSWVGINVEYTKNRLASMKKAGNDAEQIQTKHRKIEDQLIDTTWAH